MADISLTKQWQRTPAREVFDRQLGADFLDGRVVDTAAVVQNSGLDAGEGKSAAWRLQHAVRFSLNSMQGRVAI